MTFFFRTLVLVACLALALQPSLEFLDCNAAFCDSERSESDESSVTDDSEGAIVRPRRARHAVAARTQVPAPTRLSLTLRPLSGLLSSRDPSPARTHSVALPLIC